MFAGFMHLSVEHKSLIQIMIIEVILLSLLGMDGDTMTIRGITALGESVAIQGMLQKSNKQRSITFGDIICVAGCQVNKAIMTNASMPWTSLVIYAAGPMLIAALGYKRYISDVTCYLLVLVTHGMFWCKLIK